MHKQSPMDGQLCPECCEPADGWLWVAEGPRQRGVACFPAGWYHPRDRTTLAGDVEVLCGPSASQEIEQ